MYHDGICADMLVVVVNPPWEAMSLRGLKILAAFLFVLFFAVSLYRWTKCWSSTALRCGEPIFFSMRHFYFFIFHLPILSSVAVLGHDQESKKHEVWAINGPHRQHRGAIANETEYWSRQASWDELERSDMNERGWCHRHHTPNFKNTFALKL